MRTPVHKVDTQLLVEHRTTAEALVKELLPELPDAEANRNAMFFKVLGKEIRDCGIYHYAFGEPISKTVDLFKQADAHFAKTVAFGILMDPYEYIDYLSLAILVMDTALARTLATFPRNRYTNEDVFPSEAIYLLCECMGLFHLGRKELAERLVTTRKELKSAKTTRHDRLFAETLVTLIDAVRTLDQDAFDQAVAARHESFKGAYRKNGESTMPHALLDIAGLAVMQTAHTRGMQCNTQSVYLPVEMIRAC